MAFGRDVVVELAWLSVPIEREPDEADLALLDEPETSRMLRFHAIADRARFACVRANLRRRLGARLGVGPEAISIVAAGFGKPRLAGDPVWFNVAHSGAVGVVALRDAGPVGVDVETVRTLSDFRSLSAHVFTSVEQAWLDTLAHDARLGGFFRLWSAKEAVMKACGLGMRLEPRSFSVVGRDGAFAIGAQPGCAHDLAGIEVRSVAAPEGYAAAIAILAPRSA